MGEPIKVKGIIIRQVSYGDYDKMLTVLTEELGKISVSAKGVRSMKSKNRVASEILCFGEFILSSQRGEVYTLKSAECIESFFHLRDDCLKLALGIYMADIAGRLAPEDMRGTIKILLNSLYMLAKEETDIFLIKAIYDLKLLKESGFEPTVDACVNCQSSDRPFSFSSVSGGVLCRHCAKKEGLSPLKEEYLSLLTYILKCPLSKTLFSLKAETDSVKKVGALAESFIKIHVAEEIKTLDYFNKLVKMQ